MSRPRNNHAEQAVLSENERINAFYYNKTASGYETTGRINQTGNKARIRRLLSTLIAAKNVRVLDVCCGAGLYLSILKDFVEEENLFGIDISSEMLKISASYCRNVQLSSAYAIPFPDCTFDLVTCSSALHHLDSIPRALQEIWRVLKPNGVFLSDYDNNVHFAKFKTLSRRLFKLLLVYPVLKKLLKSKPASGKVGREGQGIDPHSLERLPLEEVHKLAEAQNYHFDGINGYRLKQMLKRAGFSQPEIFTYHSGRWNDGDGFNWVTSLTNNKIYSVSRK